MTWGRWLAENESKPSRPEQWMLETTMKVLKNLPTQGVIMTLTCFLFIIPSILHSTSEWLLLGSCKYIKIPKHTTQQGFQKLHSKMLD